MKYKVGITINGHLIIEAQSETEARKRAEDGYSMSEVYFDDDEIDEINPLVEVNN